MSKTSGAGKINTRRRRRENREKRPEEAKHGTKPKHTTAQKKQGNSLLRTVWSATLTQRAILRFVPKKNKPLFGSFFVRENSIRGDYLYVLLDT